MTTLSKRTAAGALLCIVLVLFSIAVIDRPVESLVAAHQNLRPFFQLLASPSLLPLPFACLYLLLCTFRNINGAAPPHGLWLRVSLATIAADAAKDELKWLFGRAWPDSLVNYGVYGFRPFASSFLYGGFPSGHTSYIAAPMLVLWAMVPRLRALWASLIAVVMIGLVGAGYHFVGDVIAGFFVGLAAAAATVMWLRPPLTVRHV